jgi:hypothetical protein
MASVTDGTLPFFWIKPDHLISSLLSSSLYLKNTNFNTYKKKRKKIRGIRYTIFFRDLNDILL